MGGLKFQVVTTTNAAGWEQTGRRMAQSFVDQWQTGGKLVIYAEDFEPDVDGCETRRMPSWLADFKAQNENTPAYNGRRGARTYDYRFDAIKFSHKVAALTDFAEPISEGVAIWLDADTFTHAPVTADWLEKLFPPPAYLAWLDRLNSHPECGFMMFRCSHPYHVNFMQAFRNLYTSGQIFKLRETHDSYAMQHLVSAKLMHGKIPPPVSLSGDTRWHHPFVNGPLGERIDHMKGPRKKEGRSRARDLRRPRSEAYWQGGNGR